MAVEANEALVAVLAFVANDADVAILAVDAFCTLFVVRANVLPSPLVYVVVALLIDAVTNKLPVLTVAAEPVATVKLNVLPSPLVNVNTFDVALPVTIRLPVLVLAAFKANEAVVANEEVTVKLLMLLPNPSVRTLPEICTRSS